MPLILPGNVASATAGAFSVANSCRFNQGDSPHMDKDQGTPTSQQKFTYSGWIKKCENSDSDEQHIFSAGAASDSYYNGYRFKTDDTLHINFDSTNPGTTFELVTNRAFRDPSAWYHIVVAVDTTQGTAANRIKLYVNGVQETSFGTAAYPDENRNLGFMASGDKLVIGRQASGGAEYFNGYMAEVVFIDGTQYAASDFGEFDEDSPTIWKPKDVSGLTFGTNGFYLDFEASDNLGNDANGGTDLGETNIAATDQSTDTPTLNMPTMNPLYGQMASAYSADTEEGNLQSTSGSAQWKNSISTMGVTAGKWFMEGKVISVGAGTDYILFGVTDAFHPNSWGATSFNNFTGFGALQIGYYDDNGHTYTSDTASSYGDSFTAGDIIGVALNVDDEEIKWYKNGTVQNSGTARDLPTSANSTGLWFFMQSVYNGVISMNYGSPAYAISSGNADANGHGNFEYAVPSGFLALNSKNLGSDGG